MCLYIDKTKTNKAKKNKTGKVIRWKVVKRSSYSLCSVCFPGFFWKPGWNKAKNRQDVNLSSMEREYGIVDVGIHVFSTEKRASCFKNVSHDPYEFIVKVICYNKDLVAVGKKNDEVYMKVFLPKDEHNDAVKSKGIER